MIEHANRFVLGTSGTGDAADLLTGVGLRLGLQVDLLVDRVRQLGGVVGLKEADVLELISEILHIALDRRILVILDLVVVVLEQLGGERDIGNRGVFLLGDDFRRLLRMRRDIVAGLIQRAQDGSHLLGLLLDDLVRAVQEAAEVLGESRVGTEVEDDVDRALLFLDGRQRIPQCRCIDIAVLQRLEFQARIVIRQIGHITVVLVDVETRLAEPHIRCHVRGAADFVDTDFLAFQILRGLDAGSLLHGDLDAALVQCAHHTGGYAFLNRGEELEVAVRDREAPGVQADLAGFRIGGHQFRVDAFGLEIPEFQGDGDRRAAQRARLRGTRWSRTCT